jgi:hypothetical protein
MIWTAFGAIFVVILLIFLLLRNRSLPPRDRLDISYSGEIPRPDVNLHYGYGMGRELSRIGGIGLILSAHARTLWDRVEAVAGDTSVLIRRFYTLTAQNTAWFLIAFFTILLYVEVL